MSTNDDNLSVGPSHPDTIGLADRGRLVYLTEGVSKILEFEVDLVFDKAKFNCGIHLLSRDHNCLSRRPA